MESRRGFLGKLFGGAVATVIAPKLIETKLIEPVDAPKKKYTYVACDSAAPMSPYYGAQVWWSDREDWKVRL